MCYFLTVQNSINFERLQDCNIKIGDFDLKCKINIKDQIETKDDMLSFGHIKSIPEVNHNNVFVIQRNNQNIYLRRYYGDVIYTANIIDGLEEQTNKKIQKLDEEDMSIDKNFGHYDGSYQEIATIPKHIYTDKPE